MKRAFVIVADACATSAIATQQPTFRSGTDLVQVDVVVVDKDGHPIRGLKQQDFTVRDRGRPQTIATFQEIDHDRRVDLPSIPLAHVARLDVSSNQTTQSGRLVVMVVDDLHIYTGRTDKAKEIARNVLTQLGPQSSMAVLFTSGEHSTQVTNDQAALAGAVETLKGRQVVRRPHQAIDVQRAGGIDPGMSNEAIEAVVSKANDASLQDFFDNMRQYRMLDAVAKVLAGGDARRKAFVLVSEGIGKDLAGLFGAMTPQGQPPEGGAEYATTGNAAATMIAPATQFQDVALIGMMDALRRANVATYAIDPRGRVDSKQLARECFPPPRAGDTDPCAGDSSGLIDFVSRYARRSTDLRSCPRRQVASPSPTPTTLRPGSNESWTI